jgi:hypothetical protein
MNDLTYTAAAPAPADDRPRLLPVVLYDNAHCPNGWRALKQEFSVAESPAAWAAARAACETDPKAIGFYVLQVGRQNRGGAR